MNCVAHAQRAAASLRPDDSDPHACEQVVTRDKFFSKVQSRLA
jgi:hypothetical protein